MSEETQHPIRDASWTWLKDALESGRIGKRVQIELAPTEMKVTYLDPPRSGPYVLDNSGTRWIR